MAGDFTLHLNEADYKKAMAVIQRLQTTERTPVMRKVFNAAMAPMVKQGKANITARNKEGKGNLKKSIGKLAYPSKLYTIAGGRRKGGYKGHVLHLVDRGTKIRYKKDGKTTGAMYKGKPTTRWAGKLYKPHGRPGAWTDAWTAVKMKVAKILLDGLEAAARKIWK